jgi:flagellar motor switch protein FliG
VININHSDMAKILEKLKSVKKKDIAIQLKDVIAELEEWLANYNSNKLVDVFNKR